MPKRTLQGVVVSDKQDKTVIVRVERRFAHPVMGKVVRRSNKFHAHDETNQYSVGDLVWIEEHKPISKLKHWAVVRGEKRAQTDAPSASNSEKRSSKKKGAAKSGSGKSEATAAKAS